MSDHEVMWSRRQRSDEYLVDASRLTRLQEIETCRAVMRLVRADVHTFQCDVPWDNRGAWPDTVVEAATVLAPLPEGVRSGHAYRLTGWISDFDDETWDAFVTFAPYAYTADAWIRDMKPVFDIDDQGTTVVVRASPDLLANLEVAAGDAEVVPLNDWTRSHRRERVARINRRPVDY